MLSKYAKIANEDDLLKQILDDVLIEAKAMIDRDPSPEGRLASRKYAFNEPARIVAALETSIS